MLTDVTKVYVIKDEIKKENVPILIALFCGLVIVSLLQLSITFFSKLKRTEKIEPELNVSWLMPVQKKIDTERHKSVPVIPKPVTNKSITKKKTKLNPKKNIKKTYSPLATKVEKQKINKEKQEKDNGSVNKNKITENTPLIPIPTPIFKLTDVPRFLHKEPLIYPESMRTLGNSGVVKLNVLIDKYGVARKVTIIESAGEEFDRQAKIAILASTFIAAKIKDKPVAALLKLSIKFNLI